MQTLSQLNSGQLTGVTRLTLSENLDSFPMSILSLADSLEILDLSNNNLNSLPTELAQLHKLKIIFLSNNPFETMPEVLGKCPNLEMIGMKSCQIRHVPASSLPVKLRWLTLTDNIIKTLPESLGERHFLQKLMLAGNHLNSLPRSLAHLKSLQLLRISANNLTEFPQQILDLPKLAWLAFSGNPFSQTEQDMNTIPEINSSELSLGKQLGQGASGIIYDACWTSSKPIFPEDIAVKVFKGGVTSDGYPSDELSSSIKAGHHPNLVQSLARVNETSMSALVMKLIPSHYKNLGLPPSLETCTRDRFDDEMTLSNEAANKVIEQMTSLFNHLHSQRIMHGDLYAHNTLINENAHILFGDFGAASMYHMLNEQQQQKIRQIEKRALNYFIDDIQSLCQ